MPRNFFESETAARWAIGAKAEVVGNLELQAERLKSAIESAICYEMKDPNDDEVQAQASCLDATQKAHREACLELWSLRAKMKLQFGEEDLDELLSEMDED